MKFGTFDQIPCADWQSPFQRYQDTLDQIQLAEELGFDNAWLAEHHFSPSTSLTPSPLIIAAAAAQRTKRIRLGVAVNLLPYHNPIRMAEDFATLDIISNGRHRIRSGPRCSPLPLQRIQHPSGRKPGAFPGVFAIHRRGLDT